MTPVARPLVRIVLAAVAVAAIVWSLVLARDARVQADALGAVNAHPSSAAFRAATGSLASAERWSADTSPKIYLAGVELLLGRAGLALRLADQVAAEEPDNLTAWRMVALAGRGASPARARAAQARIAALDPLDARR
jgi:hypothetical protein